MLTNSMGQKFGHGTMQVTYLCSMTFEITVEYSDTGGYNHLKAHLLTYKAIDAGYWLEGLVALIAGFSL